MKQPSKHSDKTYNQVDTDFRAEAIAAGLVDTGYDRDKILIVRHKGDKRYVSKDIDQIEAGYSSHELMEHLYIYTNRISIYETIPEVVFHQSAYYQKKTQDDVMAEIRRHRNEEFFARRYFQPFEMVIDQTLIDAQIYERKFDKQNFYDNLKNVYTRFWPVLELLTLRQAVFFIKTVPVIYKVSTDFSMAGRLMGIILEAPVRVELGKCARIKTSANKGNTLGSFRLGINMVPGDCFEDGFRDINLVIGPLSPEQMKLFEANCVNDLILKKLMQLMLPADCRKEVKYLIIREHSKFCLSDATHKTYLGINTVI